MVKLLDSPSKLEAVTVEGVPSADGSGHLEWNAKWCAAGEFLAQRPLKKSEYSDADEFSELGYQISYGKLTKARMARKPQPAGAVDLIFRLWEHRASMPGSQVLS